MKSSILAVATLCLAHTVPSRGSEGLTTPDQIRGAFWGALVADALCLGSHYEYDAKVIKKAYGGKTISTFMAPGERMGGTTHGVGWGRRNYHPGQKKGDQTDYGEYNIVMLEYLAGRKDKTGRVDLESLVPVWREQVTHNWGCWLCSQSKHTLNQLRQGTPYSRLGGNSNAMGMRSAAAHAVFEDEESVAHAARTMLFTHRNEHALSGTEFFARVAHKIIHGGLNPREAIDATARQSSSWIQMQVKKGIAKFEEAINPDSSLSKEEFVDDLAMTSMARLWDVGKTEPIKVGKASPTEGTLPSSVYIILKYMNDYDASVKANAMVGGDNASRSVSIGLVLGAFHGVGAIDAKLLGKLNAYDKYRTKLDSLPLLARGRGEL